MSDRMLNVEPTEREKKGAADKARVRKRGIDVPAQPGRPTPERTTPGHPGGPPEPVEPGKAPSL